MKPDPSRPWSQEVPPPAFERIPTMITRDEAQYLVWLSRELYDPAGDILEIGPWLGGSTVCLAAGMRAHSSASDAPRLHVLDDFRWRGFMGDRAPLTLQEGASFRFAFEANLADFSELVVVHEARLPDETDEFSSHPLGSGDNAGSSVALFDASGIDRPLSLAFIDGAKSWKGMAHALRQIVPILTPDAHVVFQDFKSVGAWWVPMAAGALADGLKVEHVLHQNSVTLRATPSLSERLEALPPVLAEIDRDQGLAWLGRARDLLEGDHAGGRIIDLDRAFFLAATGDAGGATGALREVERHWPIRIPFGPFRDAAELVAYATGERPSPTVRTRANGAYHALRARLPV